MDENKRTDYYELVLTTTLVTDDGVKMKQPYVSCVTAGLWLTLDFDTWGFISWNTELCRCPTFWSTTHHWSVRGLTEVCWKGTQQTGDGHSIRSGSTHSWFIHSFLNQLLTYTNSLKYYSWPIWFVVFMGHRLHSPWNVGHKSNWFKTLWHKPFKVI